MDITRALYRAVHGYPKGTEALAACLAMPRTSLLHKVNPQYPGAHCSPEEAAQIMVETGDHGAHHAQGALLGYIHLPAPQATECCDATTQALAASVREFGEFVARAAADLADGRCTTNELAAIEREGAEAIAAIHALMRVAAAMHRAGMPREGAAT